MEQMENDKKELESLRKQLGEEMQQKDEMLARIKELVESLQEVDGAEPRRCNFVALGLSQGLQEVSTWCCTEGVHGACARRLCTEGIPLCKSCPEWRPLCEHCMGP